MERLSLKIREIDERDGGDAKCQMGFRIRRRERGVELKKKRERDGFLGKIELGLGFFV